MKNLVMAALCAATMASPAPDAAAATLGLSTGLPHLVSSMAVIDYFDLGESGELLTFMPEVDSAQGISPAGFTTIDFIVGLSTADPADRWDPAFRGFLEVIDDEGVFLAGDLLAIGFLQDAIELQFGNLGGSMAASFGSSVLALVVFDEPLGANPFAALVDGASRGASITLSRIHTVAPVPLPASGLMLVGGMASIGALWRTRVRRQARP